MLLLSFVSLAISPIVGSTSTCVGGSATLTDATPGGTWSSSNPAVATVGATTGMVSGVSAGSATITYMTVGGFATAVFTVNPPTTVSGASLVCTGTTMTLTGSPSGGSWTSGTPTLATVSGTGVVTGVSPGVVNIYYTTGGCYAFQSVTVNPVPGPVTGTTTVGTGGSITLSDATPGGTWSSSNTTIATVGSLTGTVNGVAAGMCNITYTVSGCYAYASITVTTSIAPITGSTTVCTGTTTTLNDITPGGTWSSSNPLVASINPGGIVSGVAAGVATITYTVGTGFVTRAITVNITPAISGAGTACVGTAITLTGTPTGGAWSSSSTSIATAGSLTGVITPLSAGIVTINYTLAGCPAYKTITVNGTPTITGSAHVCTGTTTTLTGSITGGTWNSSAPGIATVSTAGVVNGLAAGITTITYTTTGGCYGTLTITVNPAPTVSGLGFVCEGAITTLTGTPTGGTWSSSSTWNAIVDLASGDVSGVHAGVVTITYALGGCYAYHTMTVNAAPIISGPGSVCTGSAITLTATPAGGSWTSGSPSVASVGSTGVVTGLTPGVINIYYTSLGCYSYKTITVDAVPATIAGSTTTSVGSTTTLSDATPGGIWSSSNTGVATVGSASGVVTGVSNGSCNITYSVGGCYVYTYFTVATTTILPITGGTTTCVGSTVMQADGTPGGTWSSSDPTIATIHPVTGLVTGISAGTVIITYSVGPGYVTRSFTVISAASITGSGSVCSGSTTTLSGTPTGGTWSDGGSLIASVGSISGVVTGLSSGVANITYAYTGCYALKPVTVNPAPLITGSSTICSGSSITLSASPAGGSWTSGSPSVATVSGTGVVTGVTSGVVNIYYTYGSCYSFKAVTVNTIAAISGATSVGVGGTTILSDATPGGIWSSSNPAVASIGSMTGIVSGMSLGSCNITYTYGSCFVYVPFTVSAITIGPITGTMSTCVGSTVTLSDTTMWGTWSSSNPAIATINPTTGAITGVSGGTVTISYTVSGSYVTTSFTVFSSATITGSSTVCQGLTTALTATPAGGVWGSGTPAVATVSSTGVVSGMLPGVVNITYAYAGCAASKIMTVNASPIITGSSGVCTGNTIVLTASPGGGSWTSGSPTVATVSSTGLVTGVTTGVVNIYYTASGCYSFKPVTVNAAAVISGSTTACAGGSPTTMTAIPGGGTWSSGSTVIATVGSLSGIVTALSAGVTNISYTSGGCAVYHPVTVYATPVVTGASSFCVLTSATLTGSISGGMWSSSNTAIATVSSGVVMGVSAGSVLITYTTAGGCYTTTPITIMPAPDTIAGPSTVFPFLHIMLTDATPGGTWASDNPVIASVNPTTGLVTGGILGTVNIHYWAGGCSVHKAITVTFFPTSTEGSSYTTIPTGTTGSAKPGTEDHHDDITENEYAAGVVKVFPSPTSGDVSVLWENLNTGTATITVTDMAGRKVYTTGMNIDAKDGQNELSLSSLKDGLYIMTISNGQTNYTGKIMIQH